MLVIELKNVQGWSPGSGQEGETSKRGNVICYIEANEGLVVPKAGSVVAVEGEVSYFDTARNPGEFDAQDYYRILGGISSLQNKDTHRKQQVFRISRNPVSA